MLDTNDRDLYDINSGYCGVEQLVARRAHNPKVAGSNPAPAIAKKSPGHERPGLFFAIRSDSI